ncbi:helix-turn-helix transcriptional regulator [Pseudomonas sp. NPDC090755]|uniref:helix-turn-helix transcriptional regulator n=1 Tax=Pseudomonas sp. NPDC090755 TaxID=3364481 RepID=UPI00383B7422
MSEETEVLTVEGLAKLLGRTEASIREGIRRGVPWLPKSFKMGNRHCWLKEDVHIFLREIRDGMLAGSKPGRKRKAAPSLGTCHL